ncbi:MAG: tandem-95 repeat protein [Sandaracinaceae bacterium]|nr:tandem-95 repeat protein [Sandaracinaceae bacterium]
MNPATSPHTTVALTAALAASIMLGTSGCGEPVVGSSELRNTAPTLGTIPDLTTDEDVPVTGMFTVADAESVDTLTFSAVSSDPSILSSAGITFSPTGTDRTITITPEPDASGVVQVTVLVTDGEFSATAMFTVTVLPVNDPPVIVAVPLQTTREEVAAGPIRVTVTDIDSPLSSLALSATTGDEALVAQAGVAVGGASGDFTVTLNPQPDAFGDVLITLTATDGAASSTTTFTLRITNVNDAPTISPIADVVTDEDTPTPALPFTIGDVDTPIGDLMVTIASDNPTLLPSSGLQLGGADASRTLVITPAPDQNGTGIVTITVSDGALSTSMMFMVSVTALDDPPVITGVMNVTTMEDPVVTPTLTFMVVDVDSPAPTVTAASDNAALVPTGALSIVNNGGGVYTLSLPPQPDAFGVANIVISADDGVNPVVTAPFVFTVAPVNDAPVLTGVIPAQTTNEDTPFTFTFGVSDVDDDLDTQQTYTVTFVSGNAALFPMGSIVLGGAGGTRSVMLSPALDQNGSATLRVTVTDMGGSTPTMLSVSQDVVVNVTPINDAPTIVPNAPIPNPLFVQERAAGGPDNIGPRTFTVNDVETPVASLAVSATGSSGTVIENIAFVSVGGDQFELRASSFPNTFGDETITITVTDDGAGGSTGPAQTTFTVPVSVVAVNDAPVFTVFNPAPFAAAQEDTSTQITFTVRDIDNAQPADFPVSGPSAGFTLVAATPGVLQSFTVAYLGAAGPDEGQWRLTLVPVPDASGSTQITFEVRDPVGVSDPMSRDTRTFTYTVAPVNDPPTITNVTNVSMMEDTVGTAILSFNVDDIDDANGSLVVTATSALPALVTNANLVPTCDAAGACTLTITPEPNAFGVGNVTLQVADDQTPTPGTASATFQLTVTNTPDAPVIVAVADRVGAMALTEDITSVIAVTVQDPDLCNVSGVVNGAESIMLGAVSSDTTLIPNGNLVVSPTGGTCTRTFNLGVTGGTNQASPPNANITLTATSADTLTGTDVFAVEITPVDDPPTISAIANQTIPEDGMTAALPFTVTDVDTSITAGDITVLTSNGAVVPVSGIAIVSTGGAGSVTNWTVQVTPAPDAFTSGVPVTVTVRVLAGMPNQTDRTFTVTVTAVDDPPVVSAIGPQVMDEDTTAMITVTVTDVDTPCSGITLSGTSSDQTVLANAGIGDGTICPMHVLTLTPEADAFTSPPAGNTLTVTVTANDGTSSSTPVMFTLDVQNTDDDVDATDVSYATTWGVHLPAAMARTLPATDPDPVDTVGYRADSGTTTLGGFYQVFADGTFVYAPPVIYAAGGPSGTVDTFPFRAVTGGDTGADPCNAPTCDEATATVNLSGVQQLVVDRSVAYAACTALPADEQGVCGTDFRPFPRLGTDAVMADSVQWATAFSVRFNATAYDTDANGFSVHAGQSVTGVPMPGNPVIQNPAGPAIEVLAGASGASLTALDVVAAGGEGVDARDDSVTMTNVNVSCTAAGAAHAVHLGGAGSSSTLTDVAIDRTGGGGASAALFASGGAVALGGTVTLDADQASGLVLSGVTVSSFSLASVMVDAAAVAVANRGVALDNVTGNVAVVSATITTRGGVGLQANNSTGLTLNAGGGGAAVVTEGARAIDVSGAVVALTLDSVTATASTTGAISVTGAAGSSIDIAALSATTAGGTAVALTGPMSFDVTTATSTIAATAGPAFVASNASLGVTLRSLASTGSSATGLSLTNTTGAFAVTGVGTTAGSGGAIASPVGIGISLDDAAGVDLRNMNVTSATTTGAYITGNSAVDLTNVSVTETGVSATGVLVEDLSGTLAVNGATLSGAGLAQGMVLNAATASPAATVTLTDLDIETVPVPSGSPDHDALVVSATGTTSLDVIVTNAVLETHGGAAGSSALTVSAIVGSSVQVDLLSSMLTSTRRGIRAVADGASTSQLRVVSSTVTAVDAAAFIDVLAPTSTLRYDMNGGTLAVGTGGPGRAALDALVSDGRADLRLTNVAVTATDASGVLVVSTGGADTRLFASNSPVTITSLSPTFSGIDLDVPPSSAATLDAELDGNTVSGSGVSDGIVAQTRAAGSATCVDMTNNSANGTTSSYTLGQTAGTFAFTGWNGAFALTPNLANNGNMSAGAAAVQVGTIAAGTCSAATAVTPL